jgi:hypothetical protein
MKLLNDFTPNSAAMRGISAICSGLIRIAWKTMSATLPSCTARCISGSASM